MTQQEIDRIECAIRHIQSSLDVDPWAMDIAVAAMKKELKNSTQPERKKGKWINGGRIIRCSKCGTGYAAVKGMKSALTYNFCPNCGADMRVVK